MPRFRMHGSRFASTVQGIVVAVVVCVGATDPGKAHDRHQTERLDAEAARAALAVYHDLQQVAGIAPKSPEDALSTLFGALEEQGAGDGTWAEALENHGYGIDGTGAILWYEDMSAILGWLTRQRNGADDHRQTAEIEAELKRLPTIPLSVEGARLRARLEDELARSLIPSAFAEDLDSVLPLLDLHFPQTED